VGLFAVAPTFQVCKSKKIKMLIWRSALVSHFIPSTCRQGSIRHLS